MDFVSCQQVPSSGQKISNPDKKKAIVVEWIKRSSEPFGKQSLNMQGQLLLLEKLNSLDSLA